MSGVHMQYVKWANKTDLDAFWTDPKVKRLFKNHIDSITSRVNIYNGEGGPFLKTHLIVGRLKAVNPSSCLRPAHCGPLSLTTPEGH